MNKEELERKAAELKAIARRNGTLSITPAFDKDGEFNMENTTVKYIESYDREQLIKDLERDPGLYYTLPFLYKDQSDILYAAIQGFYNEREKEPDAKRVERLNKILEELNEKYEQCSNKKHK